MLSVMAEFGIEKLAVMLELQPRPAIGVRNELPQLA